jgi:hypothetical protein
VAVDTARFEHQVGLSGPNVRIETWMYTARVNMIPFVIPSELSVESGHFVGALPRKRCRNVVNLLLAQLGQPLIR